MMKVGTLIEVDYWGTCCAGGIPNIQFSLLPDIIVIVYLRLMFLCNVVIVIVSLCISKESKKNFGRL